ncbi:MAG TPA: biopolymer transporter TolR, partial [Blastocatellia bacterium]|nr:biopolymer transporter TolR [Blastocatellia bacterium]
MENKTSLLSMALLAVPCLTVLFALPSLSRRPALGIFETQGDIGAVLHPGSLVYNANEQQYTIEGSGTNMWTDHDEFHMVWKRMKGNFLLSTGCQFVGKGVEEHRKIGWIIRSSLDPDSPYVDAAVHGVGLTSLQFRKTKGAQTEQITFALSGPDVVQLERKGDTYIMSAARSGDPFEIQKVAGIALGDDVYVGLFVCAHNKDVVEKAVFRNVQIIVPAKDNFVPYRDFIGSNLEIMDVATGNRKIIYRSPESLQAPNWTPDGKALIYTSNGLLYRFNLAKGAPAVINTAFATNNNNDKVVSFDGKMLGISNGSKEDGNTSMVYTVPVRGGTPKKLTKRGPSYMHGWSPDGKYLVFTGGRDGEFDIYKIPAAGGEEIRLTTEKGLDDGPEYSPDGKYIYFNSERSGTMQIWRMKPDGSEQERVTTGDKYND